MRSFSHILIVAFLTLLTQIGGLVWILVFGFYRLRNIEASPVRRALIFLLVYLIATFFVVPPLANLTGRTALPFTKSGVLMPHNYLTVVLNRHYVKARLKSDLFKLANSINDSNKDLKLSYLDANFQFIDGFPLLPHLSHNDGKKIDLAFYYTKEGKPGNLKPSNSGYGQFVEPSPSETNQTAYCKSKGYWQYDYAKFLTLGSRDDLNFDLSNTKKMVQQILANPQTQKILIEPHLEDRIGIINSKIKFQGCYSVRHDDHLHFQIS